jgi:beta-glucosidase
VSDIFSGHHFSKTIDEAEAAAFKTGTDLVCAYPPDQAAYERDAMLKAVQQGILPQSVIDQSVTRLFTARFRLGMFDPADKVPYSRISPAENDTDAHRQLALKAAGEAIVLLKNKDNFLPLKKTYLTIAVMGPDADSLDALVGNYNGTPSKPVTVLEGIRKRFAESRIVYAEGTGLTGPVAISIPAEALFTDSSRSTPGLHGEYFSNRDLQGAPAFTRIDRSVDFSWGDSGVSPQLTKNYSVRWTGVLVPPAGGDYFVGFTGRDGYRVWLDNKLLVEDWGIHASSTRTQKIRLEKHHAYSVKVEYFQSIRISEARLVWTRPDQDGSDAVEAAKNTDLTIFVAGLSARVEGEEMHVNAEGFSGGDRTRIDLPGPQEKLLERIYATGKPVVLVLMNGSALAVNWADQNLPAILEAWYPGEEGGTAVAAALAGDFSPGGRLPVTFYKSTDQLPPFEDYAMAKRTYRYFDGEPLYPFGYGLSYTSFSYSNPQVSPAIATTDGDVSISVDVTNTGATAGDEVAELYLTHPGVAGAALRALTGFRRVHLDPAQKTTVSFTLRSRDLSIVDENGVRRIVPGKVEVWVGGGQQISPTSLVKAPGVQAEFNVTGSAKLPD